MVWQSIIGLTDRRAVRAFARARPIWLVAFALLVVIAMTGCSSSEGEAKTSKSSSPSSVAAATATATQPPGSTQSSSTATSSTSTSPGATTGAEGTSTTGSTPPSEASAQANAICAQRNRELQAITPVGSSLREIVKGASDRAAIEHAALTKLERLTPLADAVKEWRVILDGTKARLRATERLARVSRSSVSVKQEMELINRPEITLLITATRAGLKQCAAIAGSSVR